MEGNLCIVGIKINDRVKEAGNVQRVLTQYGCSIKTRLGLHEVTDDHCSTSGLVIIELTGPQADQNKLKAELNAIKGTTVKEMNF